MSGPVSLTDAAYAAGFFDGEGCIMISTRYDKKRRCTFFLSISINQVDRRPLDWLKARFGGSVHKKTSSRSYDGVEFVQWSYVASTATACAFLRTIRPFLIVKAAQADLAFEFQETVAKQWQKVSEETLVKRATLASQMKALKRQRS